jgi:hypothetical protein
MSSKIQLLMILVSRAKKKKPHKNYDQEFYRLIGIKASRSTSKLNAATSNPNVIKTIYRLGLSENRKP